LRVLSPSDIYFHPHLRLEQPILRKGENHMQTGTVKWFNDQKGFGFIEATNGGPDVFVHRSAVEKAGMRTLREGQKISFDLQDDPKSRKTSAHNLKDISNQNAGSAPKSEADAEDDMQDDVSDEGADESDDDAEEGEDDVSAAA
jgi:CspA family cold shock protein